MIWDNIHVCWVVMRHTWIKTIRRPVPLTFSLVQPIMWMLFFGILFNRFVNFKTPEGNSYVDFLLPGVCCMTVLFGASQSGISFIRDLQTGFLNRIISTPASRISILFGKILADVIRFLVQASVILIVGLLLGVKFNVYLAGLPFAVGLLILFAIAYASLSSFLALFTGTQETMASFIHVFNMPIIFTSTALVPFRQMPDWLQHVASINPLSYVATTLREVIIFGTLEVRIYQMGSMIIIALVLFIAALWTLKRSIYLKRKI